MAVGARLVAPYNAASVDPTYRFATSWILSPALLFCIRALLSLYAFATLFTIFGWNGTHGNSEQSRRSFSYFTNLTYWGLAFYYAFAAVHTGSYWLTGKPFLARWPKALQIAHSMFYSTVVIYPFIVTSECYHPAHSTSTDCSRHRAGTIHVSIVSRYYPQVCHCDRLSLVVAEARAGLLNCWS
jgi:hypothetical protein